MYQFHISVGKAVIYKCVNTHCGGLYSCCSMELNSSEVSQGGLLNVVCLYLWCRPKGYWVSCAVEAGSQGDYRWAGNRQRREYTEACLCPWPHFDQSSGPFLHWSGPRDSLALRGE